MKINPDDPRLTAYALGELSSQERIAIEQEIAQSPEAQTSVALTRQLAARLQNEFRAELDGEANEPGASDILPLPYGKLFRPETRSTALGIAAILLASGIVAAFVLSHRGSNEGLSGKAAKSSDGESYFTVEGEMPEGSLPATSRESGFDDEEGFVTVASRPVSTFPLKVETEDYDRLCQLINSGIRPPPAAVRIEAIVNAFTYDYPPPQSGEPVSINLEGAECPWQPGHQVVRIGLRMPNDPFANANASALRQEVEVRFNAERVLAYRLLGYDEAPPGVSSPGEENPGASGMQAGGAITALYQIIPVPAGEHPAKDELLTVEFRQNASSTRAAEVTRQTLLDASGNFDAATSDFRFAMAAAEIGLILRDSKHRQTDTLQEAIARAESARGRDPGGQRTAFIGCAKKAQSLAL